MKNEMINLLHLKLLNMVQRIIRSTSTSGIMSELPRSINIAAGADGRLSKIRRKMV
ncbi:hypothetical protein MOSE0_H08284 [Monosporozyma servazzii]